MNTSRQDNSKTESLCVSESKAPKADRVKAPLAQMTYNMQGLWPAAGQLNIKHYEHKFPPRSDFSIPGSMLLIYFAKAHPLFYRHFYMCFRSISPLIRSGWTGGSTHLWDNRRTYDGNKTERIGGNKRRKIDANNTETMGGNHTEM